MDQKHNKKTIGWLLLFCGVLLFSTIEVAAKYIEGDVPPLRLAFFRFFIGGTLLFPMAFRSIRKSGLGFGMRDLLVLTGLGFSGVTLTISTYHSAIPYIQANVAAIIFCCNPVFVIVFSHFILHEKITFKKICVIFTSITGVVILANAREGGGSENVPFGVFLMTVASILFAFYTVCFKKHVSRYGAITITALASLIGSLFILPASLLIEGGFSNYAPADWFGIIYLAVFGTALAYFLYIQGISHIEASWGAMSFFLKPFMAAIFAWLILGETLTGRIITGGILIIFSILLAFFKRPRIASETRS